MNEMSENHRVLYERGLARRTLPSQYQEIVDNLSGEELQVLLEVANRFDAVAPDENFERWGERDWTMIVHF
jgi:hypothetical protein